MLKTEKNGTDNLLASHGLSKIYEFLLSRGHDTYLKELPDTLELYKYVSQLLGVSAKAKAFSATTVLPE